MTDWATVSSLATAGATLLLAVGTFASVRSANRAARTAERALLAGMRPVLVPSRWEDPADKITWADEHWSRLSGGGASIELLYSDHEGGQRTISLFSVTPREAGDDPSRWLCSVARHWNLDRPDPR